MTSHEIDTLDTFDDISALMAEPPGGENFGTRNGRFLNTATQEAFGLIANDGMEGVRGMSVVGPDVPFADGGARAHRGILSASEYVDQELLRSMALDELGFTAEQLDVYRIKGTATKVQRRLRERIDARLLEIERAGGNMQQFAQAVGLIERTVERALARARDIDKGRDDTN